MRNNTRMRIDSAPDTSEMASEIDVTSDGGAAVEISDLVFSYGQRKVLDGLSMEICKGEIVSVIGPNGAGKTTLLRLITGYLRPDGGTVRIFGKEPSSMPARARARAAALVPQTEHHVFGFSARSIVAMGRFPHASGPGFETGEDNAAIDQAMRLAKVDGLAHRPVHMLSGGEQHRVSIARALAQQTPLLLLDEPNAHLDIRHQTPLFELLRELCGARGRTVLCVTHDLNLASFYSDRIVLVSAGKAAAAGPPDEVMNPELISRHFGIEVTALKTSGGNAILPCPFRRDA